MSSVLITGAASGFGRLLALRLSRGGHRVYATMRDVQSRNAGPAQELAALPGVRVIELDVTSDASVDAGVAAALEDPSGIDVVVNNAGAGTFGITEAFTTEQWEQLFSTNLFGAVRVNRAVLPSMRRRGSGLLVHLASIAGRAPIPYLGPYCASKWALEAYAEVLRLELAPCGIDSVVVEPGKYVTPVFDKSIEAADRPRAAEYGAADRSHTSGRSFVKQMHQLAQDPDEVAAAIEQLIAMPAGDRPFRTLVGRDTEWFLDYNAMGERIRRDVVESLNVPELLELHRQRATGTP